MPQFRLIVPIADFEEQLLDEFFTVFGPANIETINAAPIVHEVFARWRWSNDVLRSVRTTCLEEPLAHEANNAQLWKRCLRCLSERRRVEIGPQHSRVQALREVNLHPPAILPIDGDNVLHVEALANDLRYWRMISNVFLAVRYNVSSFSAATEFWNIYQMQGVRPATYVPPISRSDGDITPWMNAAISASSGWQQDMNALSTPGPPLWTLRNSFTNLPCSFGDAIPLSQDNIPKIMRPMLQSEPDEFDIWSLLRKAAIIERNDGRQPDTIWTALQDCRLEELSETLLAAHFSEDYSNESYEDTLGSRVPQFPIQYTSALTEPSTYIEFIPVSDLTPVSLAQRPNFLDPSTRFAQWHPSKASRLDHVIYSSEETYRYLVNLNLEWPYHTESGRVVFAMLPLEESDFIWNSESDKFWDCWNDCAITQNPETKEWYLLQTIPGLEFQRVGRHEAQHHFFRIMDYLRFGYPEQLQESLQLEAPLRNERLVDIIPYSQLIINDCKPIGQGASGVVYQAVWQHPQKSDMASPEEVIVVLKAIRATVPDHLRKFFQELDNNLTLLQGADIGGMRFFGVMKTPPTPSSCPRTALTYFPHDCFYQLPPNTPLLVSKYTAKGNIIAYLDGVLTGDPTDWDEMVTLMLTLAEKLHQYHEAGIVHRDLSENNVVVDVEGVDDGYEEEGIVTVKILDLGEATSLTNAPNQPGGTNGDGMPPLMSSISPQGQPSVQFDIEQFGCILARMVWTFWNVSARKNGHFDYLMPECIMNWIELCRQGKIKTMYSMVYLIERKQNNVFEDVDAWDSQMIEVDPNCLLIAGSQPVSSVTGVSAGNAS